MTSKNTHKLLKEDGDRTTCGLPLNGLRITIVDPPTCPICAHVTKPSRKAKAQAAKGNNTVPVKGTDMLVPGKQFNKDLILAWLMHHLPMETRGKLIAELPAAYADVFQCDSFTVIRKDELPEGQRTSLLRTTHVTL